jgi:dienelactone hydrolase
MMPIRHWIAAFIAIGAIAAALVELGAANRGFATQTMHIDGTPITIYRPDVGGRAPVVVVAHGFAGSQQLMQSFAATFARNGYIAVTFDFAGHGRNRTALGGSLVEIDGATQKLVRETARVADRVRDLGDGRLAVLGHSMASDIVVRFAQSTPGVSATIAVSMFAPSVTATSPPNLLVVTGDWEGGLKQEALRAVGLASAPQAAEPATTYGHLGDGTARRATFSPFSEHVGVLYSQASQREALAWLDGTFGIVRGSDSGGVPDARGKWILLLLFGGVLLGWPLSRLLPVANATPSGVKCPWRRMWLPLLLPAVATPILLRLAPTHFLPILVGDYLAVHFLVYGALTVLCLAPLKMPPTKMRPILLAAGAMVAYGFVAIVWPLDIFVTSFVPSGLRVALVGVMLVGTLAYFVADEWLARGTPGAYFVSKLAFVLSLAIAVALDFERLFFLIIIVPVILLFFMVYGLFALWAYRRTGNPFAGAIANAVAFAWAIAVTFPLLAG